ncbi:MAG: ABC transporter permease [Kineosporiaceae bacterium]|nr:ABC transporter permease [Kineosporiaceae bacterium]MBK7624950.1 ABC transporter permease [Kineosporiaceae bacterium]MBK8076671.1 ABC transporter permease [Kineosporiaceae bacterium]
MTATARALAQAQFDTRIMLRNGEQLLLTMILPSLILILLSRVALPGVRLQPGEHWVDLIAPGVLALAVMSISFTGQAIGTGFDRRHGVLRMLATTPLGRSGLLTGRMLAVLAVEVVQVVVLGVLATALGWQPRLAGVGAAVVLILLGTGAFVALGLLLAGTLRAEAVLAGANLAWVLLLAGGGVIAPSSAMGSWGQVARWLPSGALGDGLRAALIDGRWDGFAVLVLAAWTIVATAMTIRFFRWE